MNPFLHDPVATHVAGPVRPARAAPFSTHTSAFRGVRPGWIRRVGTLAMAAGISLAAMPAQALDVNTATAEELGVIRGLGPKTVKIIIKERERGGRFESMEDLSDRVRGIGHKKAQSLQAAGLKVEGQAISTGARPAESGKDAAGKTKARSDKRHSGRRSPATERAASRRGAPAASPAAR
jgi:competence protein ComEA